MNVAESIHTNALGLALEPSKPVLSIVSPTYKYDPKRLIDALSQEAGTLPVELIIVDDGSNDPHLAESLKRQIDSFPALAQVVLLQANVGRSQARNRLIALARADYLLFLDSDMLPDSPSFLADWFGLIEARSPDVAYGGFSVKQVPDVPELRLARALAERMDCQNAAQRSMRGVVAVATSNLLVRAAVLKEVPFDSDFSGWGWEDAEWAVRANARFGVIHVDIPATHLGLDPAAVILRKFQQAGPNFALAAERHPEILTTQGARVAVRLSKFTKPTIGLIAGLAHTLAAIEWLPIRLRATSARLWRACHAGLALKAKALT